MNAASASSRAAADASPRGGCRNAKGVIIQEPSRLLILLYPVEEWQDSSEKIEQIREQYKQMFEQESVLRADRCCELVGF
jgi:Protein of unknown function (DUF3574)